MINYEADIACKKEVITTSLPLDSDVDRPRRLGVSLDALLGIDWDFLMKTLLEAEEVSDYSDRRQLCGATLIENGFIGDPVDLCVVLSSEEILQFLSPRNTLEPSELLRKTEVSISDIKQRVDFLAKNLEHFNENPLLCREAMRLIFGVEVQALSYDYFIQDSYAFAMSALELVVAKLDSYDEQLCPDLLKLKKDFKWDLKFAGRKLQKRQASTKQVYEVRKKILTAMEFLELDPQALNREMALLNQSFRLLPPCSKEWNLIPRCLQDGSFLSGKSPLSEFEISTLEGVRKYQVGYFQSFDRLADFICAAAVKCYEAGLKLAICERCGRPFVSRTVNSILCDRKYWGGIMVENQAQIPTCRKMREAKIFDMPKPKTKGEVKKDHIQRIEKRLKTALKKSQNGDSGYAKQLIVLLEHIKSCDAYWKDEDISSSDIDTWLTLLFENTGIAAGRKLFSGEPPYLVPIVALLKSKTENIGGSYAVIPEKGVISVEVNDDMVRKIQKLEKNPSSFRFFLG